jgi:hypothetical protein
MTARSVDGVVAVIGFLPGQLRPGSPGEGASGFLPLPELALPGSPFPGSRGCSASRKGNGNAETRKRAPYRVLSALPDKLGWHAVAGQG